MRRLILLVACAAASLLLASCTAQPASNVKDTTATFNGWADEPAQNGYFRFRYCKDSALTTSCQTTPERGPYNAGEYHLRTPAENVTGLDPGTDYWYKMQTRLTNGSFADNGQLIKFTTEPSASKYVTASAPSGNTSCTQANPCNSFQKAYDAASTGNFIDVAAGSYGRQEVTGSGTKTVTFRGAGPASAPTSVLQGLTITNPNVTAEYFDINAGATARGVQALYIADADNVKILHNRIGNTVNDKAMEAVNAEDLLLEDNVLHTVTIDQTPTCESDPQTCVHTECFYAHDLPDLIVNRNTFYDCAVMDIFFTALADDAEYNNISITNNVFDHTINDDPGTWHSSAAIVVAYNKYNTACSGQTYSGWTIKQNTLHNINLCDDAYTASGGSELEGNIGGGWGGVGCDNGFSPNHNAGEVCVGSDVEVDPFELTCGPPACGSFSSPADYDFLDPDSHDFHIRGDSAAIGVSDQSEAYGTHSSPTLLTYDRDGTIRKGSDVGDVDAGAFEW